MLNTQRCCHKSVGLLILRIVVGAIFIIHGVIKLSQMEPTIMFFEQVGLNAFWAYVVAIVETLGGLAVLLGIFTRYAAALLAIIMVVAIAVVKWKIGGPTLLGKFVVAEIDLALLGAALALAFTGSGKYSVTAWCRCLCHKSGKACKVCTGIDCVDGGCQDKGVDQTPSPTI